MTPQVERGAGLLRMFPLCSKRLLNTTRLKCVAFRGRMLAFYDG